MISELPTPTGRRKWDWDYAFALFCTGFTNKQILQQPEFKGLSEQALSTKIGTFDWKGKRQMAYQSRGDTLSKDLANIITDAADVHQRWVLDHLDRERQVFNCHEKTPKGQGERLALLDKLDTVARRTLKLDEQKAVDQTQQNFAILVYLQDHTRNDGNERSSTILRSKNAHVERVVEGETTDLPAIPKIAAPEVARPGFKLMPKTLFSAAPAPRETTDYERDATGE